MSQKMKFVDGTEVSIIGCFGTREYFHNVLRDTLEFRIDPAIMTLDEADSLFSAENCSVIVIIEEAEVEVVGEDGMSTTEVQKNEFLHENYTVRIAIAKREETVATFDGNTEDRLMICCKMGQKSEADILQMELDATNAAYDDLMLEYLGV